MFLSLKWTDLLSLTLFPSPFCVSYFLQMYVNTCVKTPVTETSLELVYNIRKHKTQIIITNITVMVAIL